MNSPLVTTKDETHEEFGSSISQAREPSSETQPGAKHLKLIGRRVNKDVIVAVMLVLLPLLYFYPAVLGHLVLMMGDGWSYSFPMRLLVGRLLAQGIVPLWNPYTFGGMPLLAAIQPGVLYPPNWLFAVLPLGAAMNAVVITTYHLTLIGSYLYARCLDATRLGALVTAVAFTFGGFMVAHLEDTNFIAASAWLPWILLAMEQLYRRPSWRWVGLGALFIALQLFAGLPQATCYVVMVCAAYGLFSLTLRGGGRRRRFAAAVTVMVVCGVMLSAVQLLPTIELQRQGERSVISYEYFSLFPMPPRYLLTLVFPYFFGGGHPPLYHVPGWDYWWLLKWAYGYVGMLGLLLALVALLGPRQLKDESGKAKGESGMRESRRIGTGRSLSPFAFRLSSLVWFWAATAVVSLVLAFGDFLPFELNHLLYRVPVYNLFRGSYRHTFEFTFAAAVLAGLGVTYLARMPRAQVEQALRRSSLALAAIVSLTAVIYRFFGKSLGTAILPSAQAASLANPEAFVPLSLFVLSVGALWFYGRRQTLVAGAVLMTVLFADLSSFGQFTYWRSMGASVLDRLADPPAVKQIKERESDLQSFRVMTYAEWPYGTNYEVLNHANMTIPRGLQSVSGYDPMRLSRLGAVAGKQDIFGFVPDPTVFGSSDQGLDLLNVKYLISERPGAPEERGEPVIECEGIRFRGIPLDFKLGPGLHREMGVDEFAATELALITTMTKSTHLPDGTPVVKLRLHTRDGRVIERELQAGRDTSEWAYDRPDVRAAARHRRAQVAESWREADGFDGHRYLARIPFERAEVVRIEFDYLPADAELILLRASLYDATTGQSTPLDRLILPPERWRKVGSFGQVNLYENLKLMPRAWFARRLEVRPSDEVLRMIREGKRSDGTRFDPAETALLEAEDFGGRAVTLPAIGDAAGARARVTRYEPQRIELEAQLAEPGFLVLSEIYYRGWEARVDGVRTPVYRADYTLRGIAVPAGGHRIEFVFRAPSFRAGAVWASFGLLLLLGGALATRLARRKESVAAAGSAQTVRGA